VADLQGRPSRQIVESALEALCRVRHRGAVAADARTGDGAGLLLPVPGRFLAHELEVEHRLPGLDPGRLGVAVLFVSDNSPAHEIRRIVMAACAAEHVEVVAWRMVPVETRALGPRALETLPRILQAILLRPAGLSHQEAERLAYRARRRAEALARSHGRGIYFPSFSFLTVTYKALVAADQLAEFYTDLRDERLGIMAPTTAWQRVRINSLPLQSDLPFPFRPPGERCQSGGACRSQPRQLIERFPVGPVMRPPSGPRAWPGSSPPGGTGLPVPRSSSGPSRSRRRRPSRRAEPRPTPPAWPARR
jgi:glutamate synthase domain-containing protein 1